ncbi:non-ribosomal peptide synthetase [Burkholderia gladioli]|uniref:non-ribosomal peptide synthetase n=1 Tax=Burkholderia gladioli TaxID=28095 RepID=UPI001641BF63|nr:non-ribosomal peptide synthetase [Burkholderia gladioli]
MAEIWTEVLGLDRVGAFDNFFELGGHSLLATQVVSRLRERFGIELPLRDLFEAPVVAALSERAEAARERLAEPGVLPALVPGARDSAPPLSYAQLRLWVLDRLEPGGTYYHVPMSVRLIGALDVDALRRTIDEIVRRHEVLRTSFPVDDDGTPVQRIAATAAAVLEIDDAGDASGSADAEARERWLALALEAERTTPFDLARGPLLRARLFRMAADDHVIALTLHHIVSDGWSMGVLVRELAALYQAFSRGEPSPLAALPVQYADYARWQRGWLTGDVLDRQLAYWRARLADAPPLLALPTDRPRAAARRHRGATHRFAVDAATTAGLHDLARRVRGTLFMTLSAAFGVLLARYASQDDICIGTPIANRRHAQTEGLIGFFVNTLVLRQKVEGRASFMALLEQVRETTLGAYAHQDVPFEQLVEVVQPLRSLDHTPLFQVMLVLQNAPLEATALPGLRLEPAGSAASTSKFDLTLTVTETGHGEEGGGLRASLSYDTDLFDASTVAGMAAHFMRVLEAAVARPDARLDSLPMLDAPARRPAPNIGRAAQAVPSPLTPLSTLHGRFEAQVRRTPEAMAVIHGDRHLGFAELDARANALARRLEGLGVGPEVRVALCVERGVEMVVGLLGILKAGGAYVPLDPEHPRERLAYLVADSAPAVMLTQSSLLERLPDHACEVVCLDQEGVPAYGDDARAPARLHNLAYVIYTSGSTGQPKGVAVEHRSALNLVDALAERAYGGASALAGARIGINASLAFDASVKQWLMLLHGACVLPIPEAVRRDADAFVAFVREQALDAFDCTPSQLAVLVPALRTLERPLTVLVGGEVVGEALRESLPGSPHRYVNVYGPTETTVDATAQPIGADHPASAIGAPLANVATYVLDGAGHPVPAGVGGELHIGGAGVARGYLGRPDLTAERFVPDPFGAPGSRMYRSGDLARELSDGTLDPLGRADQQVKLRGFRIELGEIEAALARYAGVREVAVLARDDLGDDRRLVAYLVHDGEPIEAGEWRAYLHRTLPKFMVPPHFVRLESMPLTSNGKLDRRALPAPDPGRGEADHVEPRTPTEQAMAQIWAAVLGLDRIGAHDDFFALGGHSMLGVRLFARIAARFGVQLPLLSLFEAPTLAALAARVADAMQPSSSPSVRPAAGAITLRAAAGGATPLFLVPPAGGQLLFYRALAGRLDAATPVLGLPCPEDDAVQTVEALARAQADTLQAAAPVGPYRLAGWSTGGLFALAVAACLEARGAVVSYVGLIDTHARQPGRRVDDLEAVRIFVATLRGRAIDADEARQWDERLAREGMTTMALLQPAHRARLVEAVDAVFGLTLDAAWAEGLMRYLAQMRRHLAMLDAYLPPALRAPVTQHLAAAGRAAGEPGSARAREIGSVTIAMEHRVPGDHYSILAEPEVAALAARIDAGLDPDRASRADAAAEPTTPSREDDACLR